MSRLVKSKPTTHSFVLTKKGEMPPFETIPGECEIIDANGDVKLLRYGKGFQSIYADKQSERELDKRVDNIQFIEGMRRVDSREKLLLEFLRAAGYNENTPEDRRIPGTNVLYREVIPGKKTEDLYDKKREIINIARFVDEMSVDEIRAYAIALCKNKNEVDRVSRKSDKELRYYVTELAEKDFDRFKENIESRSMKAKFYLMFGVSRDYVTINEDSSSIIYEGKTIHQAPQGIDPVDDFIRVNSSTGKYDDLLHELRSKMPSEMKKDDDERKIAESSSSKDWFQELVDKAEAQGNIERKGPWLYIGKDKWKGVKALRSEALENPELMMLITKGV